MEIENSASPMFKDRLHDGLVTEIAEREQPRRRFGWKLAWAVVSLVIIAGFGSIFLKNYFGRDFLRPSTVMAAEIVKKSLESFFRKETIYHQLTKQFLEDKTEPIVYELWEDNDTPRFLNHTISPPSVYPPDGMETWHGFFIETKESYWWNIDLNEKTVWRENYIYNKEEDRWQKLGGSVDVSMVFNELIENGILEAKEGRLEKREVYVVYDTRTNPDKYWDMLTFDKNTFQLLRTEKYEGEGDKRRLTSLVEYELQEAIPATPDNIDKFFKSYPIETKDFKYLERDFYVNEGGAKEDFKEIISETPSETANWKTYTDPKYNYSFKYPAQWEINPPPIGNGILISDQQGPNEDQISLEISSTKSDAMATSCKQIQQALLDNIAASRCEFTQEISTERGVVYNPPITSKTVYIEALHNGLYYIISLTFDQTSDKFKILDQILSTFKFLDQSISKDEAVNSVRFLNEVQGFLESVSGGIVEFDHESEDKQLWVIHVYEVKDDHTATFNWYEVDKKNGKITKMFN